MDVEDNREVLSGLLVRAGVQVAMASDGAEALQSIAKQRPDICFILNSSVNPIREPTEGQTSGEAMGLVAWPR